ncbi:hypothetical protein ACVWW1_001775 [Bradyrhizobium sp. JR3.5]
MLETACSWSALYVRFLKMLKAIALGPGLPIRMVWPSPLLRATSAVPDGAAGAGAILHHDRLAPERLQMRRQQPPHHVGRATGRRRHDDPDRLGRSPVARTETGTRQDRRRRQCGRARQ